MASDSNILLVTSCNETFYPKAVAYLETINRFTKSARNKGYLDTENWFLSLDFEAPHDYPNIADKTIDSAKLWLPLNNWCIQHGEFIDYIPGQDDDIILFTDADLRMQRPFSAAELAQLRALRPGQVFVGYNAGPKDTLLDEARRLGIKTSVVELTEAFGDLGSPCFNWGCVAATRETWGMLCDSYTDLFVVVDEHLNHVAKQQWLLSWLTSAAFEHVEMDTSFHCHGHYNLDWTGCDYQRGQLCKDGIPVLFRHKA